VTARPDPRAGLLGADLVCAPHGRRQADVVDEPLDRRPGRRCSFFEVRRIASDKSRGVWAWRDL
jgi:hypothetical protein